MTKSKEIKLVKNMNDLLLYYDRGYIYSYYLSSDEIKKRIINYIVTTEAIMALYDLETNPEIKELIKKHPAYRTTAELILEKIKKT